MHSDDVQSCRDTRPVSDQCAIGIRGRNDPYIDFAVDQWLKEGFDSGNSFFRFDKHFTERFLGIAPHMSQRICCNEARTITDYFRLQSAERHTEKDISEGADSPPSDIDSTDCDKLINPDSTLDSAAFFERLASEDGVDAKSLKDRIRICAACEKAFLVQFYYSHDCDPIISPTQALFMPPFPPEKIQYNNWKYYAAVWRM